MMHEGKLTHDQRKALADEHNALARAAKLEADARAWDPPETRRQLRRDPVAGGVQAVSNGDFVPTTQPIKEGGLNPRMYIQWLAAFTVGAFGGAAVKVNEGIEKRIELQGPELPAKVQKALREAHLAEEKTRIEIAAQENVLESLGHRERVLNALNEQMQAPLEDGLPVATAVANSTPPIQRGGLSAAERTRFGLPSHASVSVDGEVLTTVAADGVVTTVEMPKPTTTVTVEANSAEPPTPTTDKNEGGPLIEPLVSEDPKTE